MRIYSTFWCVIIATGLLSCANSFRHYKPNKKFARTDLQNDFTLLRNILEQKHPALYWYTPKEKMNFYFDSLYNNIADSMTELQYGWQVIAPLTQKIHCGHTTFAMSKNWYRYIKDKRIPGIGLYVKTWGDTMVVTANLDRKDSIIKKGTVITSINNVPIKLLQQQIFEYLPTDGYANNVNYIRLSSNFPYFHRNVFGTFKNYRVGYIDSNGNEKTKLLPMWNPPVDSTKKEKTIKTEKEKTYTRADRKKAQRESFRQLIIDTPLHTATLTLNTFSAGGGKRLRHFINQSFRTLQKDSITHLIIDLRNNGGGDVDMYTLLTKYITQQPFKVADTAYAVAKTLRPFTKYIKHGFFTNLGFRFLTKKRNDHNNHFGFFERHNFYPKKHHHFGGKIFVLINGPTFSASTLFAHAVKGQPNVLLVGEETGGGWHGNSGLMIPDITLPNTKIKVRLPLFKIVQYKHVPKTGSGVIPDWYIPPTVEAVIKGIDRKMVLVKALIQQEQLLKLNQ
jgi:C-terminal processing protease CtpA/Prc